MTEIELTQDTLIVHVNGADAFLALRSHLEIPLIHVVKAESDPEALRPLFKKLWVGIKAPGSHLPGVFMVGSFYQQGEWVFWDVHDVDRTIIVHLADERYSKLVVGVDDPVRVVAAIEEHLQARKVFE